MKKTIQDVIASRQTNNQAVSAQKIQQRVEAWKQRVSDLYNDVSAWVTQQEPLSDIKPLTERITVSEELSGPYEIEQLSFRIGSQAVRLRPKGTWVIGAQGRVDMEGAAGHVRLVLTMDKEWMVALDLAPVNDLVPLDESSFAEALDRVLL